MQKHSTSFIFLPKEFQKPEERLEKLLLPAFQSFEITKNPDAPLSLKAVLETGFSTTVL